MPPPTPDEQIQFLTNLQRLLAEGLFTATYKYALLLALADLSVEGGDESGDPLPLSTFTISEKFIELYWRHATPYAAVGRAEVLRQNSGQQAKILRLIADARHLHGDSLAAVQRDRLTWQRLVKKFLPTLQEQPLWRLQVVGPETLGFLYGRSEQTDAIILRPGVAYCFRRFYPLVQDAVQTAWLREVRGLNPELFGEGIDLREFLFGAERSVLAAARPVLADLQSGCCFYCEKPIQAEAGEVDHFIPWAKYPADLAYNLVLADRRCNGQKRDRLPHVEHLAHWKERNQAYEGPMAAALENRLPCDLASTERIAHWAYAQTESAGGLTWRQGEELVALASEWRSYLRLADTRLAPH